MKGGFLENLKSWGSSLWNDTKKATSSLTGSTPATAPTTASTTTPASTTASTSASTTAPASAPASASTTIPASASAIGGRRSRKRHMKGGLNGYTPTTGLAAHGASFSGQTAKPHTMVGGKTRKRHGGRKHKHSKSCKHNKH
jgi:hypothetical protein